MTTTAAQDEFNDLVAKNASSNNPHTHPEDYDDAARHSGDESATEEDSFRNNQINAAMRMPAAGAVPELRLPPASFDQGRSTGVKGVIADARSYEAARRNKWINKVKDARRSIFGVDAAAARSYTSNGSADSETDDDGSPVSSHNGRDEESFLQQWRESRRRELESENNRAVRNRRTSPSVRIYGRLDEVDALGYLDAIEKVGRDTTVVVYVYDEECEVSSTIEAAMMPLVKQNTAVHFVKVHYEDIEFDNAAVPAVLAYRHQGDLFANLTGIIEMIPDDESFGTGSLKKLFQKHDIL